MMQGYHHFRKAPFSCKVARSSIFDQAWTEEDKASILHSVASRRAEEKVMTCLGFFLALVLHLVAKV